MDSRKQFLAQSLLAQSSVEKQALIKNFIEDLKLQKVLTHLEAQEQIYRQLFTKEKHVVEYRQSRLRVHQGTMYSSVPEISKSRTNREVSVRHPVATTIYVEEALTVPKMSRSCSMPEAPVKTDSRSGSAKTSEGTLPEGDDSSEDEYTIDQSVGGLEKHTAAEDAASEIRIKESLLGNMKPHFMITKRNRNVLKDRTRVAPCDAEEQTKIGPTPPDFSNSDKSMAGSENQPVLETPSTLDIPAVPLHQNRIHPFQPSDSIHKDLVKQHYNKNTTKPRGASARPVFYLTAPEADIGESGTNHKEAKKEIRIRKSFCEGTLFPGNDDTEVESRRPSAVQLRRSQTMYHSTISTLKRDLKEMQAVRDQRLNTRFDLQKALTREKEKFRLLAHRVDEFLKRLQKSTKRSG